jgi:excisionase family DNA binding protein
MKTYTTAQVAKQLGISRQTLYTWIEAEHVEAPKPIVIGRSLYRLWSAADVARVRKFKGTLKPGPKKSK